MIKKIAIAEYLRCYDASNELLKLQSLYMAPTLPTSEHVLKDFYFFLCKYFAFLYNFVFTKKIISQYKLCQEQLDTKVYKCET